MIQPTVGRIVWHREETNAEPHASIITGVYSDVCVDLCVFHPVHGPQVKNSVTLKQPGDEELEGPRCEWMPYQVKKPTGSESGEKAAGTTAI